MMSKTGKPCKYDLGDFAIIVSNRRIQDEFWEKMHPQGIFGKVIAIEQRWSKGDFLGNMVTLRTYPKRNRQHVKRLENYLKQYKSTQL